MFIGFREKAELQGGGQLISAVECFCRLMKIPVSMGDL